MQHSSYSKQLKGNVNSYYHSLQHKVETKIEIWQKLTMSMRNYIMQVNTQDKLQAADKFKKRLTMYE